jgi:choline dehydrogenase-like flavoprotein
MVGGFGGVLLADALKRTARSELGAFAMLVDAKDETPAFLRALRIHAFARRSTSFVSSDWPGAKTFGGSTMANENGTYRLAAAGRRKFDPHDSMRGCQAPGFVQRTAVNPARSGRKQR